MSRAAVIILIWTALFAFGAILYLWGYQDGRIDERLLLLMGGGRA